MSEAENTETPDADPELATLLNDYIADETDGDEEPETDADETEEPEPEPEPEDDASETEETDGDKTEDDKKPDEEGKDDEDEDPDLTKRLDKIQAAEKRQKESNAKDREEIQKQIDENQPRFEALKEFDRLKARVRSNPIEVLRSMGVTDEDLGYVSRQAWYQSSEGKDDPKAKESVASERRNRTQETELDETKRKLQELTEKIEGTERTAEIETKIVTFMGAVEKSVGESSPLVSAKLKSQPEKTRKRLRAVADQMATDDQAWPDESEVVATLEASLVSDLEDLGIDPKTALKTEAKKTEEKTPPAEKKKTAKTLSNDLGKRTKPRTEPKTQEEEVEALLEMEWPQ